MSTNNIGFYEEISNTHLLSARNKQTRIVLCDDEDKFSFYFIETVFKVVFQWKTEEKYASSIANKAPNLF